MESSAKLSDTNLLSPFHSVETAAAIDGGAAPEGCLGQRDRRFFFILNGLRLRAGHLFHFQEERIP